MVEHFFFRGGQMKFNQYKVAIIFYLLIAMQVQPEFKHDHNHGHHHKHPHDHDHDHHRRSKIRKASRIYNGVRTPLGEGRFMAIMMNSETRCSAVIITGDMLLTAAHCLGGLSQADLRSIRILPNALPIQTYRYNPRSDHPLMKRIRNFWLHPRYNPNSWNLIYDIAIVQIGPQPWPLGNEVDTALMPVRIRHLDLTKIRGYGFGSEVDDDTPDHLNEVKFKYYWNETYCEMMFRFPISRTNRNIIFGVSNYSPYPRHNPRIYRNMGLGDSGGGIFIRGSVYRRNRSTNRNLIKKGFVLAGITAKVDNYSITSADRNLPYGVSAVNVTTMMPWINSIVGIDFETYPFPVPRSSRIGLMGLED